MNRNTARGRVARRFGAVSIAAAIGLGAIAFPAAADAKAKPTKPSKVKVMTRNLYLGAVLDPAIAAPNASAASTAVGEIYKHMQDMNFNARAKLLANEIEQNQPDMVGLQEVSHWLRDDAVDGPPTESNPNAIPATETVYDYLELLMGELDRRGLNYSVAVSQDEADLEFPADTTGDGVPDFDARLIMRDVILVKDGVKVKATGSRNYDVSIPVPTQAYGTVTVRRGYTYADVVKNKKKAKGTKFRFVNTHLESFNAYFRKGQADELVAPTTNVTNVDYPVVLVGDLNSDPDDPSTDNVFVPTPNAAAYNAIIGAGFMDYGLPSGTDTCCFGEDIRDASPNFTSRIDHILGKGAVTGLGASLIGTDQANRSGTGLWPTDHGGVVASLKIG